MYVQWCLHTKYKANYKLIIFIELKAIMHIYYDHEIISFSVITR